MWTNTVCRKNNVQLFRGVCVLVHSLSCVWGLWGTTKQEARQARAPAKQQSSHSNWAGVIVCSPPHWKTNLSRHLMECIFHCIFSAVGPPILPSPLVMIITRSRQCSSKHRSPPGEGFWLWLCWFKFLLTVYLLLLFTFNSPSSSAPHQRSCAPSFLCLILTVS